MAVCSGVAALGLLEQMGEFPDYPNVWWLEEKQYFGNYKIKQTGPSINLNAGYYAYFVDLSDVNGGTKNIDIVSSGFGFSADKTGGEIKVIIKLPDVTSRIPTITFNSRIVFADFEEVDRWESGCLYALTLYTNNSGAKWIVSDVEVYEYPQYYGNDLMSESDSSIALIEGVGVYLVDLTGATGGTETITLDSTNFGFSGSRTGGEIQVILLLPELSSNIPTITFGNNITFADFEEIDRWESGKMYKLNLTTNNSGTKWLVSDVEVY